MIYRQRQEEVKLAFPRGDKGRWRLAQNYCHIAVSMHRTTTIIRLALLQRESLTANPADHRARHTSPALRLLSSSLSRSARQGSCTGSPRSLVSHSSKRTGLPQITQRTAVRRSFSIGAAQVKTEGTQRPLVTRHKRHVAPSSRANAAGDGSPIARTPLTSSPCGTGGHG